MEKKTTVISPEALQRQEGFCGRVREYWQAQGITPVAFVETYGCQQNEADSEQIRGMLEHCGYGLTDGPEGADLVIFNTCAIPRARRAARVRQRRARSCIPAAATRARRSSCAAV